MDKEMVKGKNISSATILMVQIFSVCVRVKHNCRIITRLTVAIDRKMLMVEVSSNVLKGD